MRREKEKTIAVFKNKIKNRDTEVKSVAFG